jgi:hypothetical protein
MFGFGKNEEEYGFNQSWFVGRANPTFSYLKRYREDIDTLVIF